MSDDEFHIFENSQNDQNIDQSDQVTDQTKAEKEEKKKVEAEKEEKKNIKEYMLLQKKARKLLKKVKIDSKEPKFVNEEKVLLDSHSCPYCPGNLVHSHKKTVWNHIKKEHPEVDLDVELKFRMCKVVFSWNF